MRTQRALETAVAIGLLALAGGCSHKVDGYCDDKTPCDDPARPFCDVNGQYEASGFIGNTCIADPFPDAGVDDDAGSGPDSGLSPASITMTEETGSDRVFGDVVVGSNRDETFVVTNEGGAQSGALSVAMTGDSDFTVLTGEPSDCEDGVTQLAGAATCKVRVRLAPTAAGAKSATVDVGATPGGDASLNLAGNALAPGALSGSDGTHDFGGIEVSTTSSSFTWTVTNTGGVATGTPTLTNTNSSEINVTNNCTAAVAPGGNCTIVATLTPSTGGARSGDLTLSASPGGSAMVSLSASGLWRVSVSKSGTGSGTVSSDVGVIDCGLTCDDLYADQQTLVLTGSAANASKLTGWVGCDSMSGNQCTITATKAATVQAAFTAQRNVSVTLAGTAGTVTSTPSGISCGSACSSSFDQGSTMTLKAAAGANSRFDRWSGDCTGTSSSCNLVMDSDKGATATFKASYELSVFNVTTSGTVTISPPSTICAGGTGVWCRYSYDAGTQVTISVSLAPGEFVVAWSGDCSGTSTTCTLLMNQPRTVYVELGG